MTRMRTPRPSSIPMLCIDENGNEIPNNMDTRCFDDSHSHLPNPEWWITEDGYEFKVGDRLYNYYDGEWGTVASDPREYDGWFDFRPDGKEWRKTLNSVRVTKNEPRR